MNHSEKPMAAEGRLPSPAPLANPYVPFQMNNPPQYAPSKALIRGTLYSGLDLPFLGMQNNTPFAGTMLSDLQTVSFAIQELALYLDTHRDDDEALTLYRSMQKMYAQQKKEYEKKYGPLTHEDGNSEGYQWLCDPWPWEYPFNKEV